MRRGLAFAAFVVGLVAVSMGFSPSGTTSSISDSTTAPSETFFPESVAQPTGLAPGEAEAIISLGSTGAGIPADGDGHSHSDSVAEVPLDATDAPIFQSQWIAARDAIPAHDTEDEAAALGYVRATAPAGGIGTHWILWSQIAKPFDPAVPSMLLFDERRDPPVLVGYSYALQSPTRPEGFAARTTAGISTEGCASSTDGWSASRRWGPTPAVAHTSPVETSGCCTRGWYRAGTIAKATSHRSTPNSAHR